MKYLSLLFTVTSAVFMITTDNPGIDLHDKFWASILSLYIFSSIYLIIEIITERNEGDKK